jgi:PKD repeat protein
MKQPLLVLFLSSCFPLISFGQCNPGVLSNSVVVTTSATINGGFDPIWVCSGATLISDGGFHNIYLEPGAVMTSSGGIDTIWVKEGASFSMNGGIHVIFYVDDDDLNLNGGIPEDVLCAAIDFDYSNAPTNGCAIIPAALFEASDSTVCNKNCIDFISLTIGADSWSWFFEGADPSTSAEENPTGICYNSPGVYAVTLVIESGGETDTLTQENLITVFPETPVPVITQSSDTLFCEGDYAAYQWYLGDTTLIAGATGNNYVINESGPYTVVVTDSNNCQSSALINAIATGYLMQTTGTVSVFPVPAGDHIVVSGIEDEELKFFDVQGKMLVAIQAASTGITSVDLSGFPSLFYLRTESGQVKKIIRH